MFLFQVQLIFQQHPLYFSQFQVVYCRLHLVIRFIFPDFKETQELFIIIRRNSTDKVLIGLLKQSLLIAGRLAVFTAPVLTCLLRKIKQGNSKCTQAGIRVMNEEATAGLFGLPLQ